MDYQNNKKIDKNPEETLEWIDSLKSVLSSQGKERAEFGVFAAFFESHKIYFGGFRFPR